MNEVTQRWDEDKAKRESQLLEEDALQAKPPLPPKLIHTRAGNALKMEFYSKCRVSRIYGEWGFMGIYNFLKIRMRIYGDVLVQIISLACPLMGIYKISKGAGSLGPPLTGFQKLCIPINPHYS